MIDARRHAFHFALGIGQARAAAIHTCRAPEDFTPSERLISSSINTISFTARSPPAGRHYHQLLLPKLAFGAITISQWGRAFQRDAHFVMLFPERNAPILMGRDAICREGAE